MTRREMRARGILLTTEVPVVEEPPNWPAQAFEDHSFCASITSPIVIVVSGFFSAFCRLPKIVT